MMRNCFIVLFFFFVARSNGMPFNDGDAITLSVITINSTCQGANGKVIAQANGGVAPYSYDLTATGFSMNNNNGVFYKVPAGIYSIKATDATGQTISQFVTINNTFLRPNATVSNRIKPSACLTYDGQFQINASGGNAPYWYSIDNINFQTSNVITGLTAGNYQYIVKDANGCSSFVDGITHRVALGNNCPYIFLDVPGFGYTNNCNPFTLSMTIIPPSGPTAPYLYSTNGVNWQTSNYFQNIITHITPIYIKDNTGQVFISTYSYADLCNPPFVVNTNQTSALCGANGSITVTATDGTAPYQYSLNGTNYQASNVFNNLAPGTYTITVKDFYNFTSTKYAIVTNNCVKVTATSTNSTCGNPNGTVSVQATGGKIPYTFSVGGTNYTTSNMINNILPGSYFVYAKDADGNKDSTAITINNTPGAVITKVDTTHTGCDNKSGKIVITSTGGTSPLQYSINGTDWQSSNVFINLSKGIYAVTVKDVNNCISSQLAEITMPRLPPVVNLGIDKTLCEGNTLLLDATNLNSTYKWQDNSNKSTYLVSESGKYSVTVSRYGCSTNDTIDINYNLKPKFSLGVDSRICLGSAFILDPKITGVNYLWQDGSTNSTFTVTKPGLYSLTATNSCGPTTDYITIGNGVCNLYVPNTFTPNGDTRNDLFKASYGDNVTTFHLQVYNRYGQKVFETTDKNKGWDGNFLGSRQPFGAYAWIIQYKTAVNNNMQKLQGTVLLIH